MTPVARNASGSRMDRSTCDSAAKFTTASASATSGPTTAGSAMSPANEAEAGRLLGIVADRREVRLVAGVGQLVEDRDPCAVAPPEHVADVAGPDETGPTGDQQTPDRTTAHPQVSPPTA